MYFLYFPPAVPYLVNTAVQVGRYFDKSVLQYFISIVRIGECILRTFYIAALIIADAVSEAEKKSEAGGDTSYPAPVTLRFIAAEETPGFFVFFINQSYQFILQSGGDFHIIVLLAKTEKKFFLSL